MKNYLIRNAITAIKHPSYLLDFAAYGIRRLSSANHEASVRLPWGCDVVGGFASFSEFRSSANCLQDREMSFLSELAKSNRRVGSDPSMNHIMDIGAHIGITGLYLSHLFPLHLVTCFEPSPATYASLIGNMSRNGRAMVRCEQFAVCDTVGEINFDTCPGSRANARVSHYGEESRPEAIRVKAITLDAYSLANEVRRIAVLKIDTEGYESAVGASATVGC